MDPETKDKSQRTLVVVEVNEVELSKNDIILKPEDKIAKTEVLNTLHVVHNNYSFKSTEYDSKICSYVSRFRNSKELSNRGN